MLAGWFPQPAAPCGGLVSETSMNLPERSHPSFLGLHCQPWVLPTSADPGEENLVGIC